ncbi:ogr/Delta-like zinc finger family protein [Aeromonas sp. sif2433]|nr:ogr/Delta-like zinc finger family protein [Aeromonas sp. sif2433]
MRLICPHCGHSSAVRTSRRMSPLTGVASYQCRNVDCGHTFKAAFEIIATISPSALPNPAIVLPISKGSGQNSQPLAKIIPFKVTP